MQRTSGDALARLRHRVYPSTLDPQTQNPEKPAMQRTSEMPSPVCARGKGTRVPYARPCPPATAAAEAGPFARFQAWRAWRDGGWRKGWRRGGGGGGGGGLQLGF
jgi:hypothetical protein